MEKHKPHFAGNAHLDDAHDQPAADVVALRLIQGVGVLVFLWVCWRAMASPFSDNSEFWPRLALLSLFKQIFG